MRTKYLLPRLPPDDDWLTTKDVAARITALIDIEEEKARLGDAFSDEIREKYRKINRERLRKAVNVVYSYLSQGLPAGCPLPKPDLKRHGRNFWKRSTIDRWQTHHGMLIVITYPEIESAGTDE